MHVAGGKAGMLKEAGKYVKKRLTDALVNHFLDFLQFSGVMQDVASGTKTVKLTSGRKVTCQRTVHKSEIVRLYIAASEGYTTANGRPSVQTIWNILNNCPANQRKSLMWQQMALIALICC